MGVGDQVMAAGRAKLLHRETGKRVCIGKRPVLIWSPLYCNIPYIVNPGEPSSDDQIWLDDCPGSRPYIDYQGTRLHTDNRRMVGKKFRRWVYNDKHTPEPMEVVFTQEEEWEREVLAKRRFIIINPHIKGKAPESKRWPFEYYQEVVNSMKEGFEIIQPKQDPSEPTLVGAQPMVLDLRQLAVYLSTAALVICSEGLLHHLAAAFKTRAVVLFGGFISPHVTGYRFQHSIYVKDKDVLGVRERTEAGEKIMRAITPQHVMNLAEEALWTT